MAQKTLQVLTQEQVKEDIEKALSDLIGTYETRFALNGNKHFEHELILSEKAEDISGLIIDMLQFEVDWE